MEATRKCPMGCSRTVCCMFVGQPSPRSLPLWKSAPEITRNTGMDVSPVPIRIALPAELILASSFTTVPVLVSFVSVSDPGIFERFAERRLDRFYFGGRLIWIIRESGSRRQQHLGCAQPPWSPESRACRRKRWARQGCALQDLAINRHRRRRDEIGGIRDREAAREFVIAAVKTLIPLFEATSIVESVATAPGGGGVWTRAQIIADKSVSEMIIRIRWSPVSRMSLN